jgi:hypothetical protein
MSRADLAARQAADVQDELQVFQALDNGTTSANCQSAVAVAQAKGRLDLTAQVNNLCRRKVAVSTPPAVGQ